MDYKVSWSQQKFQGCSLWRSLWDGSKPMTPYRWTLVSMSVCALLTHSAQQMPSSSRLPELGRPHAWTLCHPSFLSNLLNSSVCHWYRLVHSYSKEMINRKEFLFLCLWLNSLLESRQKFFNGIFWIKFLKENLRRVSGLANYLNWPTTKSVLSVNGWDAWKGQSCHPKAIGSPWHRATRSPRRVPLRIQYWWCHRRQRYWTRPLTHCNELVNEDV